MARDYDSQLLESVSVRRRRLRDALLFGGQRTRRSLDENVGKIFGGVALAAVVCAGCVGWSFISGKMTHGNGAPGTPGVRPSAGASMSAGTNTSSGSSVGASAAW